MNANRSRMVTILSIGTAVFAVGSVIVYAATVVFRQDASSEFIGLLGGPAQLTARVLRTPVGETTGAWHYHPGYVYNVVTQGRITIEDGCGQVREYSKGQAFETSEGRVHRAYNLGSEDAIEYNMFVGPPGRPIGVNIPNNEHRCGPPSSIGECTNDGWVTFNHPAPFANQGECVPMSTIGSGSRCSFRKTRFSEHPHAGREGEVGAQTLGMVSSRSTMALC
jgi:quercetin dioxygenase-like cupin family protein